MSDHPIVLTRGNKNRCLQIKPKTYTQQHFHKGLFEARQRSLSLSDCSSSVQQLEHESNLNTLQPSPLQNTYVGQNNTTEKQMGARTNQEWQRDRVPKSKRKRNESPTESKTLQSANKRTNYSVPVHNRFEILNDDGPIIENKNKEYTPKPEPIFVVWLM
ncbi:hypothetical protein EVAR_11304_1 [Eumeta japonica]|uniref:Uncharacterized protein n=1 Tax=Eumeta variegata TaxID=151549 RepID=A0A4C1UKT6_EUMVA|nr:hypothetical protein EVAR_11304_1 [Eumeta japonica]